MSLTLIEADCSLVPRATSKLDEDEHFMVFKQYPDAETCALLGAVSETVSKFTPQGDRLDD